MSSTSPEGAPLRECRRRIAAAQSLVVLGLIFVLACDKTTPPTPDPGPSPVLPALAVSLLPASVIGGSESSGTVSLSSPAPAAGMVITLTSTNTSVTVPATVTIPPQASSVTFAVGTSQVPTAGTATIAASNSGTSGPASATLAVQPIPRCGPFLSSQVAMPFTVYVDDGDDRNHFIPSGFFGDTADLTLNAADRSSPHGGATAIRIDYRPRGSQRFAGIFWQCPENNFGTVPGAGFNLSRARQVQFWARASAPARAEFKVGGVGRGSAPFADSFDSTPTNPTVVELGTDWRLFTIDVSGRDLTRVIGGFMFVTNTTQNASGITIFLDDIVWQ